MSVLELIGELIDRQIHLELNGDDLRISAPKGRLTDDVLQQVKANKPAVIAFLKEGGQYSRAPIPPAGAAPALASPGQKSLWIIQNQGEDVTAYNMSGIYLWPAGLDTGRFRSALAALVRRYEILRTVFRADGEELYTHVLPVEDSEPEIEVLDLTGAAGDEGLERAEAFTRRQRLTVFDLARGPLFRMGLIRMASGQNQVSFTLHHIISDAWSMDVLLQELGQLYEDPSGASLAPPRIQFGDYVHWLLGRLGERDEELRDFWNKHLAGYPGVPELQGDHPRPTFRKGHGRTLARLLPESVGKILSQVGTGTSSFSVLLAATAALLYRYTQQDDLVVGIPSSGRIHPDLERMPGYFVNTLALRIKLEKEASFRALCRRLHETLADAYRHEEYPFHQLVNDLGWPSDAGRSPLFNVMIGYAKSAQPLSDTGVLEGREEGSKYDLTIDWVEGPEGLLLQVNYDTDLFTEARIRRLIDHLANLLHHALIAPESAVYSLPYIGADEQAGIERFAYGEQAPFARSATIVSAFEAQVLRTPAHPAVIAGERTLSYAELNQAANRVAHYLRNRHGVRPNTFVGIRMERNEQMMAALLGILKAGGAYVPIEPAYPADRQAFLATDSGLSLVLSDQPGDLSCAAEIIYWNDIDWAGYPDVNPALVNDPEDLIYLIYTSGSTGQPKGVAIRHCSVVNHTQWLTDLLFTTAPAPPRAMLTGTICFDSSVEMLFPPLINGASLEIVPEAVREDIDMYLHRLQTQQIQVLSLVTSHLHLLLQHAAENRLTLPSLRAVLTGGELLQPDTVRLFRQVAGPDALLLNGYGPTETTVNATFACIASSDAVTSTNIGRPIPNAQVWVLEWGRSGLCGIGVPGEICIGGEGLAQGYWQRPLLTEAAFITHPTLGRLYRSGDGGYWSEEGELQFLGRRDAQVKLRGYRIELSEVEHQLLRHESVREAVVLIDEQGPATLTAYIVWKDGLPAGMMETYLSESLPAYMVPSRWVSLTVIPRLPNGKLDRRALLQLTVVEELVSEEPATLMEERVRAAWKSVLGLDSIGLNQNFLQIGGHSLRAMRLCAQLFSATGVKLPLRDVFLHPTIRAQARLIEAAAPASFENIEPAPPAQLYELSHAQRRLWILSQARESEGAYHIYSRRDWESAIDPLRLQSAMQQVSTRHEILRTVFVQQDGAVFQRIMPAHSFSMECRSVELSALSPGEAEDRLAELAAEDMSRLFDLERGPLYRYTLAQLPQGRSAFLFTIHHIIADAWSLEILLQEILSTYDAQGAAVTEPDRIQYKDFAYWHNRQLESPELDVHRQYWLSQFSGELPVLQLPLDYPRPKLRRFSGRITQVALKPELNALLDDLGSRTGATRFSCLLAAVYALLFRYTGQPDLVVGIPLAGREHPALERGIGFYVNTVAIRKQVEQEEGFAQLTKMVHARLMETMTHQLFPFDELVDALDLPADRSRTPLFDVLVNHDRRTGNRLPDGTDGRHEAANSKFDLMFHFAEWDDAINLVLTYNDDLFEADRIDRLLGHFATLLNDGAANPLKPLAQLHYLQPHEEEALLRQATTAGAPAVPATVVEAFEEAAEHYPGRIAIRFNRESINYQRLNESVNRLARHLQQFGVERGCRVGIRMRRSPRLVTAILAVLKSGAAYVPLDPEYPAERNRFMAEDSGIALLITDTDAEAPASSPVLHWNEQEWSNQPAGNPARIAQATDLAYLIYTSGSTGTPKGVAMAHGALANLTSALRHLWYDDKQPHTTLVTASICFDVSVGQLFTPLTEGSSLVLITEEQRRDPLAYWQAVAEAGVSLVDCTPSFLHVLLQAFSAADVKLPLLTHVISAGEALSDATVTLFYECFPFGVQLINAYGPTECCVYATATGTATGVPVTIGRPLPGYSCFVLDASGALCATGISGALWIGGAGLAEGYWHRQEATALAFVDHPRFGRLYHTGDLASWTSHSHLRYEGRRDGQVKIRGFRIELGEIEACLLRYTNIRDAVVLAVGEGLDQLVAFVVSEKETPDEWLAHLRLTLPDFMVPSSIVRVDAIPKTGSGKADRKALLAQSLEAAPGALPQNAREAALAAVCSELLRREVDMNRSFFELGGHSLKAMRLITEVHRRMGVHLRLRDIFEAADLRALARCVDAAHPATSADIGPAPGQPDYPLSHAQLRIWLQAQQEGSETTHNIPGRFDVADAIDETVLQTAVNLLSAHYEILRTVFALRDGEVVQKILPAGQLSPVLKTIDLTTLDSNAQGLRLQEQQRGEASTVFDLESGPLYQVSLVRLSAFSSRVFITMHHIISDAWSMKRYTHLLAEAYAGIRSERELPVFPALQYKDFAWWERHAGEADKNRAFWMDKLGGESPQLNLPTDAPRPRAPRYQGKTLYVPVDSELTGALRAIRQREGVSLFSVLATATGAFLSKYTGMEELLIGLPVAGRPDAVLQDQLGCFINTILLKAEMQREQIFSKAVGRIHHELVSAYEHAQYPFDRLVEDMGWTVESSRTSPFDFLLNYERAEGARLEWTRSSEPIPGSAHFDWSWHFTEYDDGILLAMNYNSDLFSDSRMHRVARQFTCLLDSVTNNSEKPLSGLNYVPEAEQRHLESFQPEGRPFPKDITLHAAFEERVAESPDAVALICDGRTMSFAELNAAANRLAHFLMERKGIATGDRVGISLPRTERMIVAIWAILKAGGVYVPLDPAYPEDRRVFLAEDAGVKCILCDGAVQNDKCWPWDAPALEAFPDTNPPTRGSSENLCYLIYTSGSTGQPKGVAIRHRSVMNLSSWLINEIYMPQHEERVLLTASISFDGSVKQIFPALLHGLTLVLVAEEVRLDPEQFLAALVRQRINTLDCTPSFLHLLMQVAAGNRMDLPHLHTVLAGGEVLPPGTAASFFAIAAPGARLINVYGPTETCVDASFKIITSSDIVTATGIGRPIANAQVWVLEWGGSGLCGIGVPGEICIGGEGLAQGYWQRPLLTEAAFITHPTLGRLYRSGDGGYWSEEGELQFLGRRDAQVKLRGYRIELSEVEHHLLRHESVKEAVVLIDEQGPATLTAYIVWKDGPETEKARTWMERALPLFMVPSQWVSLEQLPRTASGKLIRRALISQPAEDAPSPDAGSGLEKQLQRIWESLLGRQVSIDQKFFDLGGHSLKAMLMLPMIYKETGIRIALRDIYQHPSIRELARCIAGQEQKENVFSIPILPEAEDYPASPAQVQLWSVHQLDEAKLAYNILHIYGWTGTLDPDVLGKALNALCQRYAILRTRFVAVEGRPRQVVVDMDDFELPFHVALMEPGDVEEWIGIESRHVFSLEEGPLFRVAALLHHTGEAQIVVHLHHIISDAWSMDLMVRELREAYTAVQQDRAPFPQPLPFQYRDFAGWHQELLEGEGLAAARMFWLDRFQTTPPAIQLPADRPRAPIKGFRGRVAQARISADTTQRLRGLARSQNCSLFTILFAGVRLLLQRYTGEEDLVIGVPLAGRDVPGLEQQLGYFVNIIALRTRMSGSATFVQLIDLIKTEWLLAHQHQWFPFHLLVDELELPHDPSRTPLFDVLVNYDQHQLAPQDGTATITHHAAPAKFDLQVHFTEGAEEVAFSLTYDADIFYPARMDRMIGHLLQLFRSVTEHPEHRLVDLAYLTEAEEATVLGFNPDPVAFASGTLQSRLQQCALTHASAQALLFGDRSLTYREFDAAVNGLARYLREDQGIRPNDRIGILLQRSDRLAIAIHAVVRAGAAYVPLDPAHPQSRTEYMIADSGARLVLTDEAADLSANCLPWGSIPFANLDASPLPEINVPDDLMYVLYTSGSTGTPKGVCITHAAFLNLINSLDALCSPAAPLQRVLLTASVTFDVSVAQLFLPLLTGAALVLIDEETRMNPSQYARALVRYGVESMDITPSYLHLVLQAIQEEGLKGLALRQVLAAGEAFPMETLVLFDEVLGSSVACFNLYGPTEACIYATATRLDTARRDTISIGQPLLNYSIFLLDEGVNPVGVGLPGEICIGGVGLASGYCNQEALTSERFVFHPRFGRLYRTGDIGLWTPEGVIEYLGRKDGQVKLNGMRVELGEIESTLHRFNGVREAAVTLVDMEGMKHLVAFIAWKDKSAIDSLPSFLTDSLPQALIPQVLIELEALPRNSSGKLDRNALLKHPDLFRNTPRYQAPVTPIESSLCYLWSEVLNREVVGVDDNFFFLGGHSLKAMRLISRAQQEMQLSITVRDIFEAPTVRLLAQRLQQRESEVAGAIPPAPRQAYYHLSYAQRRLWLVCSLSDVGTAYTMFDMFHWESGVSEMIFRRSLQRLVQRHESLRTVLSVVDGVVYQKIIKADVFRLPFMFKDLSMVDAAERNEQLRALAHEAAHHNFDLEKGPLFHCSLVRMADTEHVLMLAMHHIISDAWSLQVLRKELTEAYQAFEAGGQPDWPPLRIQYKDFAHWQNANGEATWQRHRDHWHSRLQGPLPVLQLPGDFIRPPVKTFAGHSVRGAAGAETLKALQSTAQQLGCSSFTLLLAAVQVLLHRYTGDEDMIIGVPVAGRQHSDLQGQIGYYVNTVALRTNPARGLVFSELVRQTGHDLLEAYEFQDYPLDLLVDELGIQTDRSRSPLFDVMTNYERVEFSLASLGEQSFEGMAPAIAKFDFVFHTVEYEDDVVFSVSYNSAIYSGERARRMMQHWMQIVASVCADPNQRIGEIDYLNATEKSRLLSFNATHRPDFPLSRSISDLFGSVAEEREDAIAIMDGASFCTYRTLNENANRLAHYLREIHHVHRGDKVALLMHRGIDLITAMIGVLKAGGVYVPIDPATPEARTAYMLADSGASTVITHRGLYEGACSAINWEDGAFLSFPATDPGLQVGPSDLCYIIYTSGSTGMPKGVMIPHSAVVNLCCWHREAFAVTADSQASWYAGLSFDASVWELFPYLLSGACVYPVPEELRHQLSVLRGFFHDNGISHVFLPTPVFEEFASLPPLPGDTFRLLTGGEQLRHTGNRPDAVNNYGPTECAVVSTSGTLNGGSLTIGRPIANVEILILDAGLRQVPIGVFGELFIGGAGLGAGYLNLEEMTAQQFIDHPFAEGKKLFRSGDIGRWTETGEIEFAGRRDTQIKLRGNRVDTGEVEAALRRYEGVTEARVLLCGEREAGVLAAFYTGRPAPASELRQALRQWLPEYMVPAKFVSVDRFPLTLNGKVDDKALCDQIALAGERNEPVPVEWATETERQLAAIWSEVLPSVAVGPENDFFELGGHSLQAMRLIALVERRFGRRLSLRTIFERPVLRAMASLLDTGAVTENGVLNLNRPVDGAGELFLVPPIIGSSTVFKPLALQLQGTFNCRGLQLPGFDDGGSAGTSVEEIASRLFAHILIPESRRLFLLGYSFGALVAFELTKLLEAAGVSVQLILVDRATSPGGDAAGPGVAPGEEEGRLRKEVERWVASLPDADPRHLLSVAEAHWQCLRQYRQHGKVQAGVLTFEALLGTPQNMSEWKAFTHGPFHAVYCPGDHFGIIQHPALAGEMLELAGRSGFRNIDK